MPLSKEEIDIRDFLSGALSRKFENSNNTADGLEFFENLDLDDIRKNITLMNSVNQTPEFTNNQLDDLIEKIITRTKSRVNRGGALDKTIIGKKVSWLDDERQTSIGWKNDEEIKTYRQRYFRYLKKYKNRSTEDLDKTESSTLRVLQNIGNPHGKDEYRSRGLVIGPVQGGKTEHFNGVVASAFDAGYHLVIVLSGIMEDLRKQTHKRIINDVLGRTENAKKFGATLIENFGPQQGHKKGVDHITVLTNSANDFNISAGNTDHDLSTSKTLIICKKNGGILKRVLLYLANQAGSNNDEIPILIIDDEADNASLNNNSLRGETLASLINKRIRAILKLFSKSAYIGYTASPFANILQHRERNREVEFDRINVNGTNQDFKVCDGLFPTNFIELITPPPTYIGLKHLFRTNEDSTKKIEPIFGKIITDELEIFPRRVDRETGCPITERNETDEMKRKSRAATKDDMYPKELPESLKDAVYCFILATAIRKTRVKSMQETDFHQPHNTMLIHVSRFINWQTETKKLIANLVSRISERLHHEPRNRSNGIYEILERKFDSYFASSMTVGMREFLDDNYLDDYMSPVTFDNIKSLLPSTVDEIECVALNSYTKDSLEYDSLTNEQSKSPKTYIAIGGNRLSRGFTLEGLSICYFIRDSNFADTLLQMGRWFGYRIGYLDCCKLFLTEDAIDKFNSISLTVEDLEDEIDDLSRDSSGSPDKYALKVATHPRVIKLTRPSILRNTNNRRISFSNQLEQSYKFIIKSDSVAKAYSSVSTLITRESNNFQYEELSKMFVYRKATSEFAQELIESDRTYKDFPGPEMVNYIQKCNKLNKLTDWTIAIKRTGAGQKINPEDFGLAGQEINTIRRHISTQKHRKDEAINDLKENSLFKAGGRNANISQKNDMKVVTNDANKIEAAEARFRAENPEKNLSEKVYRHLLTPEQGIIIVYLIDSTQIFMNGEDGQPIPELESTKEGLNLKNPLIGLVIGFPKIDDSPSIEYAEDKDISLFIDEEPELAEELGAEFDAN
jgi:hypothetical protein